MTQQLEKMFARDVYIKILENKSYMDVSRAYNDYSRFLDILVSLHIPYDVELWEKTYNIYDAWEETIGL